MIEKEKSEKVSNILNERNGEREREKGRKLRIY
jgi:hypothetical protein